MANRCDCGEAVGGDDCKDGCASRRSAPPVDAGVRPYRVENDEGYGPSIFKGDTFLTSFDRSPSEIRRGMANWWANELNAAFASGHSAGLREAAEIARSWYEIGPSDIPGTVAHFVKHGIAKAIESKQDRLESSGGGK